jgi:hypothetical protein
MGRAMATAARPHDSARRLRRFPGRSRVGGRASSRWPATPASAAISASITAAGAAVLMDAPPPHEDPRPFVAVAEWLVGRGFSAPDILARDLDKGCCCSPTSATPAARDARRGPGPRARALRLATDVLVELHRHPPMPGLPPHGLDQWLDELSCSPTGMPGGRDRGRPCFLPRGLGARCWRRSPPTGSAR